MLEIYIKPLLFSGFFLYFLGVGAVDEEAVQYLYNGVCSFESWQLLYILARVPTYNTPQYLSLVVNTGVDTIGNPWQPKRLD